MKTSIRRSRITATSKAIKYTTLPQNLLQTNGTILEDFENANDWPFFGGGSVTLNTTNVKRGSGSIKIITSSGGTTTATKTISLDVSATFNNFGISIYTPDRTKVSTITLYLSSTTDFTKYFTISPLNPLVINNNEWTELDLDKASWTNIGGESWSNTMARFRLKLTAVSGQIAELSYDNFRYNDVYLPSVLLCADDCPIGFYNYGYTYMKPRRVRATVFMVSDFIGGIGYFTSAQLQQLNTAGWSVGNHTKDHADLVTGGLSDAQVQSEWTTAKTALDALGIRASAHGAWPFASTNNAVITLTRAIGMLSCRGGLTSAPFFFPFHSLFKIPTYGLPATTSLATAKGYIDTAKSTGKTVVILCHNLVESGPVGEQWTFADYHALIDYIIQQRVIPITIEDFYALRTGSRTVMLPW